MILRDRERENMFIFPLQIEQLLLKSKREKMCNQVANACSRLLSERLEC